MPYTGDIRNPSFYKKRIFSFSCSIVLVLGLALGLRLLGLHKGVSLDEAYTIFIIRSRFPWQILAHLQGDVHPPLYYILLKFWSFLSTSEPFLRFLSVLLGSTTVLLVAIWLKPFSRTAAILAALFLTTLPLMLRYSQEIRQYSLLLCGTSFCFLAADRLSANPQRVLPYMTLALGFMLIVSTQFIGILLVGTVWIYILASMGNWRDIRPIPAALTVGMPAIVFLFCLFFLTRLGSDRSNWMPAVTPEYVWLTLRYMSGSQWLEGPFIYLPAAIMLLLLFGSWRRSLPFLVAFFAFLFQVILYSIFVTSIFTYRSLLPAVIPFAAVVALQLANIRMRGVRISAIILFLCNGVLFAWEWTTYKAWLPFDGSPQTAQYMKSEWRENMPVIIYPDYQVIPVRYYFPELPEETTILIKNRMDVAGMEKEFEKVPILSQKASHTIFLLVRIDAWQIKTADTFTRLLSVLRKEGPRPLILRALLVPSPLPHSGIAQGQKNLLSELEKTFGRPILFEQNDLYVRSYYEWDAQ